MKYEYKVMPIKNMVLIDYQNLLNSMGNIGWQLVTENDRFLTFMRAVNISVQ